MLWWAPNCDEGDLFWWLRSVAGSHLMAFKLDLVRAAGFNNTADAFVRKLLRGNLLRGTLRYGGSLCWCTFMAALMRQFVRFCDLCIVDWYRTVCQSVQSVPLTDSCDFHVEQKKPTNGFVVIWEPNPEQVWGIRLTTGVQIVVWCTVPCSCLPESCVGGIAL